MSIPRATKEKLLTERIKALRETVRYMDLRRARIVSELKQLTVERKAVRDRKEHA